MNYSAEEAAELKLAKPLETLTIHGRTFRVGMLSPEQWEDIDVRERLLEQARLRGEALPAEERDPTHILVHLLWAGEKHPVYQDVLPYVSHEHLVAARREAMRQRVVASLI